jgi:glycerate kinase
MTEIKENKMRVLIAPDKFKGSARNIALCDSHRRWN